MGVVDVLIGRPEGRPRRGCVLEGRVCTSVLQDDRAAEAGLQPVRSPVATIDGLFQRAARAGELRPTGAMTRAGIEPAAYGLKARAWRGDRGHYFPMPSTISVA